MECRRCDGGWGKSWRSQRWIYRKPIRWCTLNAPDFIQRLDVWMRPHTCPAYLYVSLVPSARNRIIYTCACGFSAILYYVCTYIGTYLPARSHVKIVLGWLFRIEFSAVTYVVQFMSPLNWNYFNDEILRGSFFCFFSQRCYTHRPFSAVQCRYVIAFESTK